MSTLTREPAAGLLNQLFADAERSTQEFRRSTSHLSPADIAQRVRSLDYLSFYSSVKDHYLAVSAETGRLLYMLAVACRATSIVEFGTSFGVSTLHLAAAVRDNGGGRVIGSEFEPGKVERARANLQAAGLDDLVEIREGDALETLSHDLPDQIDLLLLDGAKPLYARVLAQLEPKLKWGALIVADNANWCPEYLERVRDVREGYLSLPFGTEVEVSLRLAP